MPQCLQNAPRFVPKLYPISRFSNDVVVACRNALPERFTDIKLEDEVRTFYHDCYGIELTPERARALFPTARK